mgnify:CR=1 FL=1
MSEHAGHVPKVSLFRGLFFKCTMMVAICVLLVVAIIEVRHNIQITSKTQTVIQQRALEVTKLLSKQIGGSVKFQNQEALAEISSSVSNTAGDDLKGIAIYNVNGDAMHTIPADQMNFAEAELRALAQAAISTGQEQTSPNGMSIALPVRFGAENGVVGAAATQWTNEFSLAVQNADQRDTLYIGMAVFAVALLFSALFLRQSISKPLVTLIEAMQRVASDDLDASVPFTRSKDEIGRLAQGLDQLRHALSRARKAQIETVFKSAAFEGSSAAMMLVDDKLKVLSANASCAVLFSDLSSDLHTVWTGYDGKTLVGADLMSFSEIKRGSKEVAVPARRKMDQRVAKSLKVRVGNRIIAVTISPAHNELGDFFGCVIEWADRTEAQHDRALIKAIDDGQLNIQFDKKGKVVGANQNFLELIEGSCEDAEKCSFQSMFAGNLGDDPDGEILMS